MFDQMKQLYELQKNAKEMKKKLEQASFEKSDSSGGVRVSVDGTHRIKSISIDASWLTSDRKESLEKTLGQVLNHAMEDVEKEVAAMAMKNLSGLKMPGL